MPEENEEKTTADNGVVNAFVNAADNESLNAAETARNHADTVENAAEIENEPLVNTVDNAADNAVDNEYSMPVEQEENAEDIEDEFEADLEDEDEEFEEDVSEDLEEEELEDEFDFPEDDFEEEEEEDDDVLGSYAEDESNGTKSVEEVVNNATGDSAKNLDALKDLGELVIDFLDDSKAQVCSAISGQPSSQYASGQKLNKALLKAFVAYMDSQEVKAPTPLGTLLLTLALWGLPALGTAYFHRRKAKKAKKQQAKEAIHQEANLEELESEELEEEEVSEGEAKSDTPDSETNVDYTQTKEYKDKRRMFDLHANTGCYSRDLTGKFAKTSLAGEKPSSELQALIDQNFDNAKIRSIIYPK